MTTSSKGHTWEGFVGSGPLGDGFRAEVVCNSMEMRGRAVRHGCLVKPEAKGMAGLVRVACH